MRNIMIFAAVMIGLGTLMAAIADRMTPVLAHPAQKQLAVAEPAQPASARTLNVPRNSHGSYITEGRIEGQRLDFMVDTGASVIALNESSAARFGLRPSRSDYKATVRTANGTTRGAPARIAMIEIGGLVARDVDAMVLPDEALSENLLGMSFLSKLTRMQYVNGIMVLEQ